MKKNIRALGIDDSYFVPHKPGKVEIVGVVMRAPNYIEGILIKKIEVDGLDCSDKIVEMLSSRFGSQLKVILTQGMTFGGFNILDMDKVYRVSRIPIMAISRKMPNMEEIKNALKKHFPDWKKRWELLSSHEIQKVRNKDYDLFVQSIGLAQSEIAEILELFTVRGAIPEPLRVAHLIASALHFGESRGKP
ncbi:MAG: DUF99 family protein [Thermoplasmata archaeon]|uniref:UPF0215 protein ENL31_01045 n=1 Tax=Candidatus Aciduliprofundum boonei TaxID=379547 RepID=A0A7J3TAU3_9ARCH|nr:DUF99 family protein [Thermoplasmata archaeon]HHE75698.1 DUF99 family protein [Candidatus Aciduliprofundum boonei]